ncbi:phage holin family protein [Novosphingobium sp. SL115]|uniref:phage holin family protein n=1 Tax=Novosphingobium sp. SL115 TaxID=2995150 RepID=UPI002272FF76|nr:phage holin family protein [Novosphingobium sp. SL115]MCY1671543.1 phage holin family protein [Novosphingobium sp. SL115]
MNVTEQTTAAPAENTNEHDLNPDGPPDSSLGDAVRALIEDGQTLVEAEIAYRKAQAGYGLGQGKTIALLLVLALGFGFFTLLALVVGLLLALTPLIGVWGALSAVGGGLLVLMIVCLLMARSRIKNVVAAVNERGAQP